jgi:hypothetical protein
MYQGVDPEKYALAVQLRQPEFVWMFADEITDRVFFGVREEGEFSPRGYYYTRFYEDGHLNILYPDAECLQQTYTKEMRNDPITMYKQKKTKFRTLRKGTKHYVVEVGRIVDLVKFGYDRKDIHTTQNIPFLWMFRGFVYRSEGFDSEAEARAYESTLVKGYIS